MEGTIKKLREYILSVYIPVCLCISFVIIGSFYSLYTSFKQNDFSQRIDLSIKNIKNDLENSKDALLIKYLSITDDIDIDKENELFNNKVEMLSEDIKMLTDIAKEEEISDLSYGGKTLSFYTGEISLILKDYSESKDFTSNKEYFNYLNSLYIKMQADLLEIENIVSNYNINTNNSLRQKLITIWCAIIIFITFIISSSIKKSTRFEEFLSKRLEEISDNAKKIIDDKEGEIKFDKTEKDEKIFEREPDEFMILKEAIIKTGTRVDTFKEKTKNRVSKFKNENIDFTKEKEILRNVKNVSKIPILEIKEEKVPNFKNFKKDFDFKNIDFDKFDKSFANILNMQIEDNSEDIKKAISRLSFLALNAANEAKEAGEGGLEFELIANEIFKQTKLLYENIKPFINKDNKIVIDKDQAKKTIDLLKDYLKENENINKESFEECIEKISNIESFNKDNFDNLLKDYENVKNLNKEMVEAGTKLNTEVENVKADMQTLEAKLNEKEYMISNNYEKNNKIIKDILNF